MTLLSGWTTEQIFRLAPDPSVIQDAKKMANASKWAALGRDEQAAWGLFQGSGSTPYQIKADLVKLQAGDAAVQCTCPSRKQPCKHCLALLLVLVEQPANVPQAPLPAWVQAWLNKQVERAKRAEAAKTAKAEKPPDPAQQAKTEAARKKKIAAGLEELGQWLENIIRGGLSDAQLTKYQVWNDKAARMVDAQAPGVGTWLKALAGLPNKGGDHTEPLLTELGRLYLLTHAFKRYDALASETQADLRSVIGWNVKGHESAPVRDYWLVTGRYEDHLEDKLRMQRLWLFGAHSRRHALIMEFAFVNARFETTLLPGMWVNAEVSYLPSRAPLRATMQVSQTTPSTLPSISGFSIQENVSAYSAALSGNPWLLQYPFIVDNGVVTRHTGRFAVRGADGLLLPIAAAFGNQWSLLSLGAHRPLRIMGEWDGEAFLPLSAMFTADDTEQRFVDFNGMRKD
jgi:hypothetical protein